MSKITTIRDGAALIDEFAYFTEQKYLAKHFEVHRHLAEDKYTTRIIVKIDTSTSTIGRILRNITGTHTKASLTLEPLGNDLKMTLSGGMWWDKILAFTICWFFLWPLLVTMILGIIGQNKLHNQIYIDSLQWFDSRKAWLDGRTKVQVKR